MYRRGGSVWWREVRGEPTRGRGRQGEEAGVVVGGVGGEGGVGGVVAGETSVGVRVPVLHRNLVVSSLHRALVVRRGVTRQEVAGAGAGAGAGGAVRVQGRRGGSLGVIALVTKQTHSVLAVYLEMFPQGGGVGVCLVAASHPAGVRLVRGVDMHVLLPVARVGEPSVTALNLALEWFLT